MVGMRLRRREMGKCLECSLISPPMGRRHKEAVERCLLPTPPIINSVSWDLDLGVWVYYMLVHKNTSFIFCVCGGAA